MSLAVHTAPCIMTARAAVQEGQQCWLLCLPQVQQRYLAINAHAASYTWKALVKSGEVDLARQAGLHGRFRPWRCS